MSLEKTQDVTVQESKAMVLDAMAEACRRCIPARALACEMATLAVKSECDLPERIDVITEFMASCTEGPELVGSCGTERKECQHPDMPEYGSLELTTLASRLIDAESH